jgi:hypothetical protein
MSVFRIDGSERRDIIAAFLKQGNAADAWNARREDTEKGGDVSDHTLSEKSAAVASRRSASQKEKKLLGNFYDQTFYAARHAPGKALSFPFPASRFNAMIYLAGDEDEKALRRIGLDLLQHGLRYALCHGPGAKAMGQVLDDLIDEHGFSCEGLTAYTSVHQDESLAEAVEYFVLPAGLAETSFLVVIGNDADYRQVMRAFTKATSHLRERV